MQVCIHIHACQWLQDVVIGEPPLPWGEAAILDKVKRGGGSFLNTEIRRRRNGDEHEKGGLVC